MGVAETVGFRFEADFFESVQMIQALVVMDNMDNIKMFHHKKTLASENVGFGFEADLFKSVQIIIICGCLCQN